MQTSATLPAWLDACIFDRLGATLMPAKGNMTVIEWNRKAMLTYLGTYFPRSYAESYCIFRHYFSGNQSRWRNKKEIDVLGFGCGTGGDILGLLSAIADTLPELRRVNLHVLDGNRHCLNIYEDLLEAAATELPLEIDSKVGAVAIDDNYDLAILDSVIDKSYDIIVSFKAIGEFATRKCFGTDNPYARIASQLIRKLKDDGIMLLADITSYSDVYRKWFPVMLDDGIEAANGHIVCANPGYSQEFSITHSRADNYTSKLSWRIIEK